MENLTNNSNIIIREAVKDDCPQILLLIKKLAEYEKKPDEVKLTTEDLVQHGFDEKLFTAIVAENLANHSLIGFALFFYSYSTWNGRGSYLEDIFVESDFRKLGIGKKLFHKVVEISFLKGSTRMDFSVLNWNDLAIDFYKRNGAADMTIEGNWHLFRVTRESMKTLLASKVNDA